MDRFIVISGQHLCEALKAAGAAMEAAGLDDPGPYRRVSARVPRFETPVRVRALAAGDEYSPRIIWAPG